MSMRTINGAHSNEALQPCRAGAIVADELFTTDWIGLSSKAPVHKAFLDSLSAAALPDKSDDLEREDESNDTLTDETKVEMNDKAEQADADE